MRRLPVRAWLPSSVAAIGVATALIALPARSTAATSSARAGAAAGKLEMLFVQNARSGSLTPLSGGRYRLTLHGVDPHVVYFSDRPQRVTGVTSNERLIGDLFGRGDPPNAAVQLSGGDEDHDAMAVELGKPRYDKRSKTLTYTVRGLRDADSLTHPRLAGMRERLDDRLPARFGAVSLFIDDSDWGNTCTANIVDNAQGSFFEDSSQALSTDRWDSNPTGLIVYPNQTKGWKTVGGSGLGCSNTVRLHTWDGGGIVITTQSNADGSNTYTCTVADSPTGWSPYTCTVGPGSQLNGPVLSVNWVIYQSPTQSGG